MLNTHKGTVVRVALSLAGGAPVELDPLKQTIGGLVFDGPSLRGVLSNTSILFMKAGEWSILDNHGGLLKPLKFYAADKILKAVVVFVVYPDGTIWEGQIGGNLKDVSLIAWSDEIIRSLSDPTEVLKFYQGTWNKTPTSLVIRKGGSVNAECARIEHSCGQQCEKSAND